MTNDTTIQPLTIKDVDSVREVDNLTQHQYLGDKWNEFSFEEKEEHLVSRKSEFQINVDTGYGFTAKINEKVVGFIFAFETLPFKGNVFIRYIGINPNFQGKGIGQLLFESLISKAKENGITKIRSYINLDNPHSIKLHEKVGFTLTDRKQAILEFKNS